MKVYVACHSKEEAAEAASSLRAAGFDVSSTWHTSHRAFLPTVEHTEDQRTTIAREDADEVRGSDALLLIAGPEKYSGGKFVEAGIALGRCRPVVVLGRRENLLLWHPSVHQVESIGEAAEVLIRIARYAS